MDQSTVTKREISMLATQLTQVHGLELEFEDGKRKTISPKVGTYFPEERKKQPVIAE